MKIGTLRQHCGQCSIIDYCGNPYGFCICTNGRFHDLDEHQYNQAAKLAITLPYSGCQECNMDECEGCDQEDEQRDHYCEQIADYVQQQLIT